MVGGLARCPEERWRAGVVAPSAHAGGGGGGRAGGGGGGARGVSSKMFFVLLLTFFCVSFVFMKHIAC